MRIIMLALLTSLMMAATAEEQPTLGLADVSRLAVQTSADVSTAELELETARRNLSRVQADPLALRIPLLQAEHSLERATTNLEIARLNAANTALSAYANALEADSSLRLADMRLGIASTQLEATVIRFNAGAATNLDLERARNELATAERDLADARQAQQLAYDNLLSLMGLSGDYTLPDAFELADIPTLEDILAELPRNTQRSQALQALQLAEAQLAAVDNAFSPRSEIDAARDQVTSARTRLGELERNLSLSIRQTYNGVLAAQSRLQSATASLETAREDVSAQQVRFDAGSISLLQLEQSKLSLAQAETQLQQAQHGLAAALRQLELGIRGAR